MTIQCRTKKQSETGQVSAIKVPSSRDSSGRMKNCREASSCPLHSTAPK